MQRTSKYMKEHVPIVGVGQPYNDNKWRGKAGHQKKNVIRMTIEDLVKTKTIYPTLVIPFGNDGSTGHAICVVDDLIFDSTQENALKLCRESLDWICGKYGCKDIYYANRFHQPIEEADNHLERNIKIIKNYKICFVIYIYIYIFNKVDINRIHFPKNVCPKSGGMYLLEMVTDV